MWQKILLKWYQCRPEMIFCCQTSFTLFSPLSFTRWYLFVGLSCHHCYELSRVTCMFNQPQGRPSSGSMQPPAMQQQSQCEIQAKEKWVSFFLISPKKIFQAYYRSLWILAAFRSPENSRGFQRRDYQCEFDAFFIQLRVSESSKSDGIMLQTDRSFSRVPAQLVHVSSIES